MRLLVMPLAVLLLLVVVPVRCHTYKYAQGSLPKGNDVVPPQNLTVVAAEAACSALPRRLRPPGS